MARDLFHHAVKTALEKDGWTITDDPFKLVLGADAEFFIDLAAERLIVATKENEKIAVEIKSFLEPSKTHEFHAVHIHLKNGFVWVEEDNTDYGVVEEMVRRGFQKEEIVLAFHAPYKRPHTGYATGT